ncbi:peptidylprolyl isomerase [Sulfurirhabdus autotrophica]|uniref:peptidylprolyl isomerase n=1 Tax=Sulfurirhabdus autotrophica TaxID=1706046 RepID=A0A4R3Y5J1_9PROT|nr:peptidylprolyl isomerase [Sulfurirhabdus autotrophica]TCV86711.1 peptidyl-prolyl cis-trans isomerase C [Sulfurirhabdus autotrophica]
MPSKTSRLALLLISSMLTLSACNAQEPAKNTAKEATAAVKTASKAVVSVNGIAIPQDRIDFFVKQTVSRGQADSPELRKAVTNELISRELMSQEATKKGLDKDAEVAAQIDLAKQTVLVGAYIQDYLKANPVSDDLIKAEYDKLKAQIGSKEYKVRHILVEKEAEAKDIIAQLKKGAKFDKLATEKSKDTGSKAKGGDLNWMTPSNVVKPFGDAMMKLKKGQYTQEPVQSQFGWHVIKLDDERDLKAPTFEEVKPQLAQRLQQEQIQKGITELRTKSKIEIPEEAAPAAAPAEAPAEKK